MYKILSRVLQQPFYAWLSGIYPILYLYSENLGLVIESEVQIVFIAMLIATTLAFLFTNLLLHNRHKTAFILSICSLVFSLSGHVYSLVFIPNSLDVWSLMVLIVLWIILALLWRSKSQKFFAGVTPVFNLIMLAMLLIPGGKIISSQIETSLFSQDSSELFMPTTSLQKSPKIKDSATHPDIYYIIPDAYPSDGWLQKAMNYDNSEFTKALEARGFTVVKHAQTNYAATLPSLASTLNMQYFDQNPSPFSDLAYLRLSIANNTVAHTIQEYGYTYIQFLSGYLIPSPIADINRDFTPEGPIDIKIHGGELPKAILEGKTYNWVETDPGYFYKQPFMPLYIDTTLLRVLANDLEILFPRNKQAPYRLFEPRRFLSMIDEVDSIVAMPEATFTIIHLMKPHWPTTFNEHGDIIGENAKPSHQEYFAEFGFTNSKFLQMIDTILQEGQNPPVIIFQADHGSIYGEVWTKDQRLTHFDTYAAYYLPESYAIEIPKPYTLINTFPLILNEIFDTNFEWQEDRLMELLVGYDSPFNQRDVTEIFTQR